MLQRNPLQPPRPFLPPPGIGQACGEAATRFLSAEDFDATGVLAGVDPCESRYWWIPELYEPESRAEHQSGQATRRTSARPTAAA